MSRDYFDRYQFFIDDGKFRIVPGIEIAIKGTDKYIQYKKGKDRLDKMSQEYYGSPTFGWLILQSNPTNDVLTSKLPFDSLNLLLNFTKCNLYFIALP